MTNAEKETIIRWDCEDRVPVLYPLQAARWTRIGYHVTVMARSRDGTARSWSAKGAPRCVRFRRLKEGAVVTRTTGGRNLPARGPSRARAALEVL
jgi:hypothetical protein